MVKHALILLGEQNVVASQVVSNLLVLELEDMVDDQILPKPAEVAPDLQRLFANDDVLVVPKHEDELPDNCDLADRASANLVKSPSVFQGEEVHGHQERVDGSVEKQAVGTPDLDVRNEALGRAGDDRHLLVRVVLFDQRVGVFVANHVEQSPALGQVDLVFRENVDRGEGLSEQVQGTRVSLGVHAEVELVQRLVVLEQIQKVAFRLETRVGLLQLQRIQDPDFWLDSPPEGRGLVRKTLKLPPVARHSRSSVPPNTLVFSLMFETLLVV